jgi:hypothetical protein
VTSGENEEHADDAKTCHHDDRTRARVRRDDRLTVVELLLDLTGVFARLKQEMRWPVLFSDDSCSESPAVTNLSALYDQVAQWLDTWRRAVRRT